MLIQVKFDHQWVRSYRPTHKFRLTPTLRRFGFNTTSSQLLTVPPYIIASTSFARRSVSNLTSSHLEVVVVMWWAIWSDRVKRRAPFLFSGLFLCLVGFAINITNAPIGVKYFGTYLIVIGGYAAHPAVIAWYAFPTINTLNFPDCRGCRLTNNLAGHYKRAVGIAFQGIFGNTGGLIASNMFRSQDAPRYITGRECTSWSSLISSLTLNWCGRRGGDGIRRHGASVGSRRDVGLYSREHAEGRQDARGRGERREVCARGTEAAGGQSTGFPVYTLTDLDGLTIRCLAGNLEIPLCCSVILSQKLTFFMQPPWLIVATTAGYFPVLVTSSFSMDVRGS